MPSPYYACHYSPCVLQSPSILCCGFQLKDVLCIQSKDILGIQLKDVLFIQLKDILGILLKDVLCIQLQDVLGILLKGFLTVFYPLPTCFSDCIVHTFFI